MSDTIKNRLKNLHDVLVYDSEQQTWGRAACFTTFERICINQERGSLLSQLNQDIPDNDVRYYKCPPKLEIKIRFAIQKVQILI